MSSPVQELPVDPLEIFLKDKSFCVKLFYRTSPLQFLCVFIGFATLSFFSLGIVAMELIFKKQNEILVIGTLVVVLFVIAVITVYAALQLRKKEEFIENLRSAAFRDLSRRISSTSNENGEQKPPDADLVKLKNLPPRGDSTSPLEGGEQVVIPVLGEGKGCNKGMPSTSIQVHKPLISSPESADSSETTGRAQETASSSEKQDSSVEESAVKSDEVSPADTLPRSTRSSETDNDDESVNGIPRRSIFFTWPTMPM